ncbi:MAG: hypothetical protein BGO28_07180 [Alphaproteobacteria bacterium 43-37]|nr:MAG: hypothetical protein BGO28_07180 [Alphaproteobacteria bacterium 43-37]
MRTKTHPLQGFWESRESDRPHHRIRLKLLQRQDVQYLLKNKLLYLKAVLVSLPISQRKADEFYHAQNHLTTT